MPPAVRPAYQWFLPLPAAFVLAVLWMTVLWMAGVGILGSVALVLYSVGWVLVRLVAGSG